MPLEALLTRLEVTSRGELLVSFRDKDLGSLGSLYVPDWKHVFPTKILGKNYRHSKKKFSTKYSKLKDQIKNLKSNREAYPQYKKIRKKLRKNLEKHNLRHSSFKSRLKDTFWWIYQFYAPVKLKDRLPKEFIRGNYTQQARWRLTNPGNLVELDDIIISAMQKKKNIKKNIFNLKNEIEETSRSEAYATKTINDLDELFDKNPDLNLKELTEQTKTISSLREIDSDFLKKRKNIANEIRKANDSFKGELEIKYSAFKKNRREHSLRLEKKDSNFLTKARMPSVDEFMNMKWLFLDIEIPHFMREDSEITWVGMKYCKEDKIISEIYTVYDLAPNQVNDYSVKKYKNTKEMIEGLTKKILELDPNVISTYNTKFDLIKLRESIAEFLVGEDSTNPLYKVTTHFFERIGIRNRFVIDFFRWQKIARAYDINAKLEMAAGFRKKIDYEMIAKLEDIILKGGKKAKNAAKAIARYLTEDVDNLYSLFMLDEFRNNLEDALWMCDTFNLGLERILHIPNTVNDFQEKGYFKRMGIYRKNVPPHLKTRKNNTLETRAREYFMQEVVDKSIRNKEIKGLSKDVYKVYIPIGDFFRRPLSERSKKLGEFFNYKDTHRSDKKRLFFLEQYSKAFSRWMVTDYGFCLQEEKNLDKLLLKSKISIKEFNKNYSLLRNSIYSKRNRSKDASKISKRLAGSHISVKNIDDYIYSETRNFLQEKGLTLRNFTDMVNQKSKINRTNRRFAGNHGLSPDSMKDILKERFQKINEFLDNNKLEIVAKEGSYLYVKGNKAVLENPEAPIVMVDETPVLLNEDNVYYEKNGFFSNIKFKEHADYHSCMFEMNNYKKIIEHRFKEKDKNAIGVYKRSLIRLESADVSIEDLLFLNKSKNIYFAYTTDSDSKTGKTQFVLEERFSKGPILFDEEKKLKYFMNKERGEEIKVYIMNKENISFLNIDINRYKTRFMKKGSALLKSLVNKK